MLIVVAGCAMLYVEAAASTFNRSVALGGYYLLAFLFGGNPLIVSWIVSNTAGSTKKSVIMAFFNGASAVGNIVGPLLFKAEDAPRHYLPGVRAVMIIFVIEICLIAALVVVLYFFNKQRRNQRIKNGKPEFIHDTSMDNKYSAYGSDEQNAEHAAQNLGQNGEFLTCSF